MQVTRLPSFNFTPAETQVYRQFSDVLRKSVDSIETGAKYISDPLQVVTQLTERYHGFMLEEMVPSAGSVIGCFIDGGYRYFPNRMRVEAVKSFLALMRGASNEERRVILANLQTVLSAIRRHEPPLQDDIPF